MTLLQLVLGFALLVAGGEALVRGSVSAAARLGVSPLLIGLTLVGFGTSTPELVTSLQAAFDGLPGIAIGNVVGSNIANVLLILGLTAIIAPVAIERAGFGRDGAALALATGLCIAVVLYGTLDRWLGSILVAALIGYLVVAYVTDRPAADTAVDAPAPAVPGPIWVALGVAVLGIAVTILGARLAVDAAVALAMAWGLSETVVGLTIVAVGTSLPELVTSVMAALRREPGLAFGNVVGSNIYNILGILGVTALVRPIAVPDQIASLDIWVMTGAAVALIAAILLWQRIGRATGLAFLASYAGYTAWLVVTS
jgi:cation:H+ antiporter